MVSTLQKASHVQLLACEGTCNALVIQQLASTLGDVGHSHHQRLERVSDAALVAEKGLLLQILEALLQGRTVAELSCAAATVSNTAACAYMQASADCFKLWQRHNLLRQLTFINTAIPKPALAVPSFMTSTTGHQNAQLHC